MAKVYSGNTAIDSVLSYSGQATTPVNSWSSATTVGQAVSLTYDWMTVAPGTAPAGGFQPFTAAHQAGAIAAMALVSEIAGVTFTYTAAGTAQIEFGTVSFGGSPSGFTAGLASNSWTIIGSPATNTYYTHSDVYLTNSFASIGDQTPGGSGFATMLHELGHGLGLEHTFENKLPPAGTDTTQYSVMSYTDHPSMSVEPSTFMLYDIAALQYLYGANTSTRAGNDVYSWATDEAVLMTIWDGGGTDTISAATQTRDATINLGAGLFSSIGTNGNGGAAVDNIAIAYGATIENATGGSGNDAIIGNSVNNVLSGLAGNDTLAGGNGIDTLFGGSGNDLLYGGAGVDQLVGGAGNDNLYVVGNDSLLQGDAGYDQVIVLDTTGVTIGLGAGIEYAAGNSGNDTIHAVSLSTAVIIGGGGGNDNLSGGSAGDTLAGGDGNDNLYGNNGNDVFFGGAGVDNFFAGDGDDKMYIIGNDASILGGSGFDQAIVLDATGVSITLGSGVESASGSSGNDTISASSLTTAVSIGGAGGHDTLTGGTANDTLAGGNGNDVLFGLDGSDTIFGGGGNDFLFGGGGNDLMVGGTGSDTFYFLNGSGNDFIQQFENGQDKFNFAGHTLVNSMANLTITNSGGDAYVTINSGGQILAFGAAGLIEASDFVFA